MTEQSMLLQLVRITLQEHHYRPRLQRRWYDWIRRFLRFCGHRHPSQFGEADIQAFLNHIVEHRNAGQAAQNYALQAMLFLYGDVLSIETKHYRFQRPKRSERQVQEPFVLFPLDVEALCSELQGQFSLVAKLLYGSGLHLRECLALRVKDVNFERCELQVRGRKGRPVRPARLPPEIVADLRAHLHCIREQHDRDLQAGAGHVAVPEVLRLDFPDAAREWAWQWCFPASETYVHPITGHRCRHHLHESLVQRAIRNAALAAHLPGDVSASSLRQSSIVDLFEQEACA